ncbi:glycoside hydrolase family 9 protein [Microbacterium deminutum]|uniref:Cellulase Ig-like domain-containing protein n=1 Tax=Microbacterium deminutum TaxID=344164 RepID=A0ABN2R4U4_9MICO
MAHRHNDNGTAWTDWPLLHADMTASLDRKSLGKPVLRRQWIDDMETDPDWRPSPVVELGYTTDRAVVGTRSLRMSTLLRNPDYIRASREPNGTFSGQAVLFEGTPFSAVIAKHFDAPQDWSEYNRLSLWVYVHPTDHTTIAFALAFLSEGSAAGPEDPIAIHYFSDLKAGAWNQLAWEIPEIRRDAVTEVTVFQPTFGVTGSEPRITYDLDALQVELVDAEVPEGWSVPEDKISYSHFGYTRGGHKLATAPAGEATEFEVLSRDGQVAASLPAAPITNERGSWTRLDFSTFTREGEWRLRYDGVETEVFPISDDAHLPLVEATLNAFYGLRCGWAVPGVHGVCHSDVFSEHEGDRRSVAGGWHDAANLTQGPGRTHLSIYALSDLADSLYARGATALADRAREEVCWGIAWSLGTRFGPGLRALYNDASYYTDGVVGTDDDMVQEGRGGVAYDEFQNILGVLAMARAARTMGDHDAGTTERLIVAAAEDFAVTYEGLVSPVTAEPVAINASSWRDRVGYLCLAAVELYRSTGDLQYRDAAIRLGRWVLDLQETRFVAEAPVTGFFYEDAARTRIVHEYHDGFEDSGLLALAALREEFVDSEDWIDWHTGLALYADYFCHLGSEASAPFGMIPAAVWRAVDLDAPLPPDPVVDFIHLLPPTPLFPTPPTRGMVREQMQRMFEDGMDLGGDYRLRRFPLWCDHVRHGATTVHLGKTIGLAQAAIARGSAADMNLASRQLEWVVGANPFSRSLVYGVGFDWWQNFSAELPNLVGGLSLGFNSYTGDTPAWGNNAVFPYKEQWVYSSSRMAMVLARVGTPARVRGEAPAGATFTMRATGDEGVVAPGSFDLMIPAGEYDVQFGGTRTSLVVVDGARLTLRLDESQWLMIELRAEASSTERVRVTLDVSGEGSHSIALRTRNLDALVPDVIDVELARGATQRFELDLQVTDAAAPWTLVAIPDRDVNASREVGGSALARSRHLTRGAE